MAFANIFLALKDGANTTVQTYLDTPEEDYDGPVSDRAGRFFKFMADQKVVSGLFAVPNVGGSDYYLYSISFSDDQYSLSQIKDEIDWMLTEYPTDIFILGAWKYTGEQYGTEHVYTTTTEPVTRSILNPDYQPDDQEPDYDPRFVLRLTEDQEVTRITGKTGTAVYPLHAQLINFMPDVWNGDEPPTYSPATELTDVNLLAGQSPRSFF